MKKTMSETRAIRIGEKEIKKNKEIDFDTLVKKIEESFKSLTRSQVENCVHLAFQHSRSEKKITVVSLEL